MGAIHFSIDRSLVDLLQQELGIRRFIETGTFRGDTVASLAGQFDSIDSVEFSPEYYQAACERFAGCPHIRLHQGNSAEILRTLMPSAAHGATLFWLDAHWCAADHTAGEKSQCPLLGELQAIGQLNARSVIMIDDARYFLCAPPAPHEVSDWPGFQEVLRALALCGASVTHRVTVLNDVILLYPDPLHARITEFASLHGADWLQIASKAGTFDRLVADYGTDWSQAAAKAAQYDAAHSAVAGLTQELADVSQTLSATREALASTQRELKKTHDEKKKAKQGLAEIQKRPARFLLRSWMNWHPLYPGEGLP